MLLAWSSAGCSLLFEPNRDLIRRDGAVDAGQADAGDAGYDAGFDAGPSCTRTEDVEVTCIGGTDEDCDGNVDCFDLDCRGAPVCCTGTIDTGACLDSTDPLRGFEELPVDDEITFSSEPGCEQRKITRFSLVPGVPRALVSRSCQPVGFGMTYEVELAIETACSGDCVDFAALSFGLVQQMVPGAEYEDEFRFVISPDGSAYAERAGARIGRAADPGTFIAGPTQLIRLRVELSPGPSAAGIDVLYATATVFQMTSGGSRSASLLEHEAVMPLDALACFMRSGGTETGLFAVIEGTGNQVSVRSFLGRSELGCANPSQFRPLASAVDLSSVEACDVGGSTLAGGVGAPSLVSYCYEDCDSSPLAQWDLWVDGSARPRDEDEFDFVDFGTCGFSASTLGRFPSGTAPDQWVARTTDAAPYLFAIPPSAREPTVLPARDDGALTRVATLYYAYARRMSADHDDFEIWGGTLQRASTAAARAGSRILGVDYPGLEACVALRDPLLVAKYQEGTSAGQYAVSGAYLLFTCDRMPGADTIGVVEVHEQDGGLTAVGDADPSFVTASVGAYASRGVFGPEGFTEPSPAGMTLRLWFLARSVTPRPTIAYAQGRGPLDGPLAAVDAYPANPILTSDSPVLQQGCDGYDCRLHALSVTPIFNDRVSYQFLVARERRDDVSVQYDLVPLLQPRPLD